MANPVQPLYGASNQAITITLASLASGSARASLAIDNTTNKFKDAPVFLKIKTGTIVGVSFINVYAYGTCDGGTTYTDGATGADAALTLVSPPNLRPLGVINAPASNTTYYAGPFSPWLAFGCSNLPDHWGIVIENKTGGAFDATEANHAKSYQGTNEQI